MCIFKYNILDKKIDTNKPHINRYGYFVLPNMIKSYNYYLPVFRYNPNIDDNDYFILLGNTEFNKNCSTCKTFGSNVHIMLHNKFAKVIANFIKNDNIIDLTYIESTDTYDVWQVTGE